MKGKIIFILTACFLIGAGSAKLTQNEATAIGIIGGADDSSDIYADNKNKDIEIIGQADGPTSIFTTTEESNWSDIADDEIFKFDNDKIKEEIKKDYDNAAMAFGVLNIHEINSPNSKDKLALVKTVITSDSDKNGNYILNVDTYSSLKKLLKANYTLSIRDENNKLINTLKVKVSNKEETNHLNKKEVVKGLSNNKNLKLIIEEGSVSTKTQSRVDMGTLSELKLK